MSNVLKVEMLLEGGYRIHKLASDFSAINNLTDIWETSDGSSSVESLRGDQFEAAQSPIYLISGAHWAHDPVHDGSGIRRHHPSFVVMGRVRRTYYARVGN